MLSPPRRASRDIDSEQAERLSMQQAVSGVIFSLLISVSCMLFGSLGTMQKSEQTGSLRVQEVISGAIFMQIWAED